MQRRPYLDLLAALAFGTSLGCGHAPVPATTQDRSDYLRGQLSAADDDVKRAVLKDELARVELQRAREVNTAFAYRRFLAEFPGGEESTTARSLLEQLRFDEAQKANSRPAWEAFLDEHPRGRKASEARQALGALEIRDALDSKDLALTRRVLARYPDHPQRPQLSQHEDDLAWAAASAGGAEQVQGYLFDHPAGAHRAEALRHKESAEQDQLLVAEDLAKAEQRAQAADAQDAHRRTLAELKLRLALQQFDLEALKALATTPPPAGAEEVRDRAAQLVASLERSPLSPEVEAALAAARPGAGLPARAQLLEQLKSGDPFLRVQAMRQLAEWSDPADVDTALDALDSRYVGVRLQAVELLRSLATSLKPAVWTRLAQAREQDALGKALSAGPWRRVAALRDAAGRTEQALAAWREVERNDLNDVAARARIVALEQQHGDRLAYASAVRELAKAAATFGDERWLQPLDERAAEEQRSGEGERIGIRAEIPLLRQLCSAIELESSALTALTALRQGAGAAEQELLGLATSDAERVLRRLQAKRTELETDALRREQGFVVCGTDVAGGPIRTSREARRQAIARLGSLGDRRVQDFVRALAFSPSSDVRAAAAAADQQLQSVSPEPPPPPAPAPLVETPAKRPAKKEPAKKQTR